MTRVLHVIPGLGIGGAESVLAGLVSARRENAPDATVADLIGDGESANRARISAAGVPVHDMSLAGPISVPRVVRALSNLIRDVRPDVVQGWMYYGDLLAAWALRRSGQRSAARLYWGVRCSDMDFARYGWRLRLVTRICARVSGYPDAVIANSETGRRLHGDMGYSPHAFHVIPNGIDTSRFRPDEGARASFAAELGLDPTRPIIVSVARVDPMKDYDTFLAVADRMPDMQFVAVGKGTEELPARPNLRAPGIWRNMREVYAAADFAVSVSAFGEGFSNAIAEAMACGTPVVATDVGDASLIVGDAGKIVPPRDPAAVAAAIRGLGEIPLENRLRLGEAARARIEAHFSLERMVAAFDRLHHHGAPD